MAVAHGAEWREKLLRTRDAAVEASGGADLSAEADAFPAENLRTTMQKIRHLNHFKKFAADRRCISLND
jgi:hypothetical protein